ncbi:MAG: 4Fe-4S binding protein [Spirochaetaceae bacterium]|nr:4Fe-4S binding protein [Spirochaetaceae bacterium]
MAAGRNDLHRESPAIAALQATIGALFGLVGRRALGKLFFADSDCTRCGLCARICPAGTIEMKGGSGALFRTYPFWKANCENCCRCINLCPARAINSSWGRLIVIGAVSAAAAWAALGPFIGWLRPIMAALLEGWADAALGPLSIAVSAAAFVLSQALVLGPFERYILRPTMRQPALGRFFSWTFTKEYERYSQEGFRPSSRETAP